MGFMELGNFSLYPLRRNPQKPGSSHLEGEERQPRLMDTPTSCGKSSRSAKYFFVEEHIEILNKSFEADIHKISEASPSFSLKSFAKTPQDIG